MKFKHCLALAATTLSLATQAASYNQNLINNGDAESGASGWTAFDGYDLFQSVNYGSNWVLPTQPGPADHGSKMFTGVGAQSAGFQIIDVSSLTATGAPVEYSLTGWLGGWQAQGDNALLYVSFLDITGHEIGFAAIGPVTPDDRGNQTGLFFREASGMLPVGCGTAAVLAVHGAPGGRRQRRLCRQPVLRADLARARSRQPGLRPGRSGHRRSDRPPAPPRLRAWARAQHFHA